MENVWRWRGNPRAASTRPRCTSCAPPFAASRACDEAQLSLRGPAANGLVTAPLRFGYPGSSMPAGVGAERWAGGRTRRELPDTLTAGNDGR